MKYPLYSIRDLKASFMAPMVDINEASAVRNFKIWTQDNRMSNFAPSDFEFYQIGEFDSETGRVSPLDAIQFVISGTSAFNGE